MGPVELENARIVFAELARKGNLSVEERAAYAWSLDVLVKHGSRPLQKARTLQGMATEGATQ